MSRRQCRDMWTLSVKLVWFLCFVDRWTLFSILPRHPSEPCYHFFLDSPVIADVNTGAQRASTTARSCAPGACALARPHRCPLPKCWHVPTWNKTGIYISEMRPPLWRKGCKQTALKISFLVAIAVLHYGKSQCKVVTARCEHKESLCTRYNHVATDAVLRAARTIFV